MKLVELATPPDDGVKLSADTIVVTSGWASQQVIALAHGNGACHVLQKDNICYEQELALATEMLTHPDKFFQDPMKSITGSDTGAGSLVIVTNALAHKREVLEPLQAFLEAHSKSRAARDDAMVAADEIFTNASKNSGVFYERAVGDDSSAVHGEIQFCAHIDDERLTLMCSDSYGLLKVAPVIQRIGTVFQTGVAGAIQNGHAGAGIGSFMIFNSCSSYYLGVDAGKKTVVGCSFQLTPRSKDRASLSKNIHCITIGHV